MVFQTEGRRPETVYPLYTIYVNLCTLFVKKLKKINYAG